MTRFGFLNRLNGLCTAAEKQESFNRADEKSNTSKKDYELLKTRVRGLA